MLFACNGVYLNHNRGASSSMKCAISHKKNPTGCPVGFFYALTATVFSLRRDQP